MGDEKHCREPANEYAAVCGLYCEACSWFISTKDDMERLKRLADQQNWTVDESQCHGCRSGKRLPYCERCRMFACAAERGIDFCSECGDYPCDELKQFQSAMPHRIELWASLDRLKSVGYQQWLRETRDRYTCPRCQAINSAYDLRCRRCGEEPSCGYVADHRQMIELHMRNS